MEGSRDDVYALFSTSKLNVALSGFVRLRNGIFDFVIHSSRHQIACFKATEGVHPSPFPAAALRHKYSVGSFATLRVLSCLHSPGLRCSCWNIVRFCCDLEACNLLTATVVVREWLLKMVEYSGVTNRRISHCCVAFADELNKVHAKAKRPPFLLYCDVYVETVHAYSHAAAVSWISLIS
jgi:hypothetical protein